MNPEDILNKAKKQCEQAEVFIVEENNKSLFFGGGLKEKYLQNGRSTGIALRVIKDGKIGFSFTSTGKIDELIKNATKIAGLRKEKTDYSFPCKTAYPKVKQFDKKILDTDIMETGKDISNAIKDVDNRIDITDSCVSFVETSKKIANTEGINVEDNTASLLLAMDFKLAMGNERDGLEKTVARKEAIDFYDETKKLASELKFFFSPQDIKVKNIPVVLDRETFGSLVYNVLVSSFFGDRIIKGNSILAGKTGQNIFGNNVTIRDSGTEALGWFSSPSDSEGSKSRNNVLVEEGILKKFLYDSFYATIAKTESTGNGVREGFMNEPETGNRNFIIEPNLKTEKMLNSNDKYLFVRNITGAHTANDITGDFSVVVDKGYIFDKGKKIPVKNLMISGNIFNILKDCLMGDDVENITDKTFFSGIYVPSILTERINIIS